jgi:DNA-binding transcriptional MocR family regulator
MQALTEEQQRDIVQAHQQGTEQRTLAAEYGVSRATISRIVSRAERRAVESLQAQTVGPQAIDPQTGASFEVADEDLLRSLARCLARDFQQTANIAERANIARTIAQLVQTRHRIAPLQLARQIGKLSTVGGAARSMPDPQADEAMVIFS